MRRAISFALLLSLQSAWGEWSARKAEGWAWHEEQEGKSTELLPEQNPSDDLNRIRRQIEERLSVAVLHPTEENVLALMKEQQRWLKQSERFSKVWTRLLLQHPDLDFTAVGAPTSQYGLQLYKEIQRKAREALITAVAREHGLFFFYDGNSRESELFAFVVGEMSRKYGWKVIGISLDGAFLEAFPDSKRDNGIVATLGVPMTPSLYAVNPQKHLAVPISFGLASLDQIESNVVMQFTQEGESSDG